MKYQIKTILFASLATVMILSLASMSIASAADPLTQVTSTVSEKKSYKTCGEKKIVGVPYTIPLKKYMNLHAQYWEQDSTSPDFKLKYKFPETILKYVQGTCIPHKELKEIHIVSESQDNENKDNDYVCYNRGYLNGHPQYDEPAVTKNNSLTDTVDGFPNTDRIFADLTCDRYNPASDVGDLQHIGVRGMYENLETGETDEYRMDGYVNISNGLP